MSNKERNEIAHYDVPAMLANPVMWMPQLRLVAKARGFKGTSVTEFATVLAFLKPGQVHVIDEAHLSGQAGKP